MAVLPAVRRSALLALALAHACAVATGGSTQQSEEVLVALKDHDASAGQLHRHQQGRGPAGFNLTEASYRCDREACRQARNIWLKYVLQPHGMRPEQLPSVCPLHPARDLFAEHENHKITKTAAQRQCKYCKKIFRTEAFLDKHLQRKHLDLIPKTADACLADLCDVLHCDWFAAATAASLATQQRRGGDSGSRRRSPAPVPGSRMMRDDHCMPYEAARTRSACQELAHTCFPVDTEAQASSSHHHSLREAHKHQWDTLHEFWMRNFCQAATCTPGARDQLLQVVRANRKGPQRTLYAMLAVVFGAMALVVSIVCCWSSEGTARQRSQQQQHSRALHRRGLGPQAHPVVMKRPAAGLSAPSDPSGKLGRKPPPPTHQLPPRPHQGPQAPSAPPAAAARVAPLASVIGSGVLTGHRPGGSAGGALGAAGGVVGTVAVAGHQVLDHGSAGWQEQGGGGDSAHLLSPATRPVGGPASMAGGALHQRPAGARALTLSGSFGCAAPAVPSPGSQALAHRGPQTAPTSPARFPLPPPQGQQGQGQQQQGRGALLPSVGSSGQLTHLRSQANQGNAQQQVLGGTGGTLSLGSGGSVGQVVQEAPGGPWPLAAAQGGQGSASTGSRLHYRGAGVGGYLQAQQHSSWTDGGTGTAAPLSAPVPPQSPGLMLVPQLSQQGGTHHAPPVSLLASMASAGRSTFGGPAPGSAPLTPPLLAPAPSGGAAVGAGVGSGTGRAGGTGNFGADGGRAPSGWSFSALPPPSGAGPGRGAGSFEGGSPLPSMQSASSQPPPGGAGLSTALSGAPSGLLMAPHSLLAATGSLPVAGGRGGGGGLGLSRTPSQVGPGSGAWGPGASRQAGASGGLLSASSGPLVGALAWSSLARLPARPIADKHD